MRIKVVQVGKNSRDVDGLCCEFLKRISAFAKMEIVEVGAVKESSTYGRERCMAEEGEAILSKLDGAGIVVVLDDGGKQFSSEEFADFLSERRDAGEEVVFVIGGAFGLSEPVLERANLVLSLSKMTFTHQMVRVILLEQIYRGFCIAGGREYHY